MLPLLILNGFYDLSDHKGLISNTAGAGEGMCAHN